MNQRVILVIHFTGLLFKDTNAESITFPNPKFVLDFLSVSMLNSVMFLSTQNFGNISEYNLKNYFKEYRNIPTSMYQITDKNYDRILTTCQEICPRSAQVLYIWSLQTEKDFQLYERLMNTRNSSYKEFWLLGLFDETYIQIWMSNLKLDIDDDIFVYWEPQIVTTQVSLSISEIYKINKRSKLISLPYGKWNAQEGLIYDSKAKWVRRQDMQGSQIIIASLYSPPFVILNDKTVNITREDFQGTFGEIFMELQELMNFTFVINPPKDNAWGALINGEWNGMIRQLQRDEIDIAVSPLTVTKERSTVMTFATPVQQIHHRFFIRNPVGNLNYLAYIDPFKWDSWIVIICLTVVSSVMIFLIMSISESYVKNEFTIIKSFIFSIGTILRRPWEPTPTSFRGRLGFICVILFGSMIYYHWEAMLISYLAARVIVLPFTSIEGLMSESDYKILVLPGSSFVDAFQHSKFPLWRKAYEERIEKYLETYPATTTANEEKLKSENELAYYIDFDTASSWEAYKNCEVISIPKEYDFKPYAFGFQKDSPLLGPFNHYIKELIESGQVDQILKKNSALPQVCPDYSGQPLGLNNCFTAFGILLLALTSSFVILIAELFFKNLLCRRPYDMQKMNNGFMTKIERF